MSKFGVRVKAHPAENCRPRHPNSNKQREGQVNCKTAFWNNLHLILEYFV